MALPHHTYRRDIDGMRALAVMPAVVFHASVRAMPGGFAGVEIFFVISGYLITQILLHEMDAGLFSFRQFYFRRCRRILPALLLVMVVSLILGWFIMLPDEFIQLGKHITASALFYQNIILWHEVNYFDTAGGLKPLLHLWSLSVEEQYYMIWPLLIVWTRRGHMRLKHVIIALLSVSVVLNLVMIYIDSIATFYLIHTRFWELLIGSALAWYEQNRHKSGLPIHATGKSAHVVSLVALTVIILCYLFYTGENLYPGWRALPPTLAALALIAVGPRAVVNRYLLGNPLMVFIGLISYPLYLWHWPLIVFSRLVESVEFSHPWRAVAIAAVLSVMTYYFLERPMRRKSGPALPRVAFTLMILLAVMAVCGLAVQARSGFSGRFPPQLQTMLTYTYDETIPYRFHHCFLDDLDTLNDYRGDCVDEGFGAADKVSVLLWGDSHAAHLYPGLAALQSGYPKLKLAQFNRSSCPPLLEGQTSDCEATNRYVLQRIKVLKPNTVILAARWLSALNVQSFSPLDDTIQKLKESGVKNVVVIGPLPRWHKSLMRDLYRHMILHHAEVVPPRLSVADHKPIHTFDTLLKDHLAHQPVAYVSAYDIACNDEGCLTQIGQPPELFSYDYGHLTGVASAFVIQSIPLSVLGLGAP